MPEQPLAAFLYAEGAQNWSHFDRGIPRYVVEHLRAIHALEPELIDSVLLNPRLPLTGNLSWLFGTSLLRWNTEDQAVASRWPESRRRIYHVMSPFELGTTIETVWPRWARDSSVATVVTLYDLIPVVFADHYLRDPRVRAEYTARLELVRAADQVLAISQATADDAVTRLGISLDHVHVIHAGATEKFGRMFESGAAAWAHLRQAGRIPDIRPEFLLYVGGFEFRKNLEGLIRGYGRLDAQLRRRHQLVIACRLLREQMGMLRQLATDLGIGPSELVLTGYVSDAELGALYHACKLFVFPSLYEGSGLPVLEAMSCAAPIAASSTPTAREVLGDSEATFEPRDPDAIAACLAGILRAPAVIDRLRARSIRRVSDYTWSRVGTETREAYTKAVSKASRRRSPRRRIALVTPWPPEQSGIADYNLRLATELGGCVDVDIVVARAAEEYPSPLERGIRLISAQEFEHLAALRQHDRIVYCMGNSRFHDHAYQLLRRRPGAVVFHDVQLTGFYGWYAGVERPEDPGRALAERVRRMYENRLPWDLMRDGAPTWDQQQALGIYMTRELQSYAQGCFVHSRFAQDVLELDRAPGDRSPTITVLPFGMPAARETPRNDTRTNPLIVSLGYVHEVKGLATLISAFALLAERVPSAELIIAGPTDAAESARWRSYANEHAPNARVEIPGHVSTERYSELLQIADLAVQLRLASNGEASAAVADCLSSGLPTIVTDLGWTGELPEAAAEKVPVGVEPDALRDRMLTLLTDQGKRTAMSEAARAHARYRSFSRVAEAYISALDVR